MSENFTVYRVISLVMAGFGAQKNVVIRANIANIVDSVIVRWVLGYRGDIQTPDNGLVRLFHECLYFGPREPREHCI